MIAPHLRGQNRAQVASVSLVKSLAQLTSDDIESKRVDLHVEPGVWRLGTPLSARGRWYDSSLIRWTDGVMRAVGGWERAGTSRIHVPCRGEHVWSGPERVPHVFFGGTTNWSVYREDASGDLENNVVNIPSVSSGNWHVDNFGTRLIIVHESGQLIIATPAAGLSLGYSTLHDAPATSLSVVVTPERFVVSLGADGDPHKIAWSSQGEPTVWAPTESNTAGDLDLPSDGSVVTGLRTNGETLIWTESDLIALRYIGPPFIYGATKVGRGGIIGSRAKVDTGSSVYWMGDSSFWVYDGFTKRLPCPVADYVFDRLNSASGNLVWATSNDEFSEVTWFYPSGDGECDSYVTFNYEYGIWYYGDLARTGGVTSPILTRPVYVDAGGLIYSHETGSAYDDFVRILSQESVSGTSVPFASTGIIDIDSGKNRMYIDEIHPDDVTSDGLTYTLEAYDSPNGDATIHGPYDASAQIDTRIDARHIRFLVEQNAPGWRFGIPRLEARPSGEY